MEERRRSPRISSRIPVEFVERSGGNGQTLNVSRHGILLTGSGERELNSLVRLKLLVPPDDRSIEIFGRVARQTTIGSQSALGIEFLELNSDDRDHWIQFVTQIETLDKGELSPAPKSATPPPSERRKSPRKKASFLVRFRSREGLDQFVAKNVSTGGMFLATPVLKPKGVKIQVVLIHPETDDDFEISAQVVRVNEAPTENEQKGMALEFVSLSEKMKEKLSFFMDKKKE